ncbi:MAG: hypothetical protein CME69_09450 [Halobacteriovorax sp.]|nr:hypothetical protein [Halobacteriovorax sp.]
MDRHLNLVKSGSNQSEKRVFPRFPFSYLVFRHDESDKRSYEVKDISYSGMRICLKDGHSNLLEGDSVSGEIHWLKNNIQIDGVVKRVDDDSIGIVFNGGRESELKLKDFLSVENVAQCLRSIHDYKDQVEIPTNLVCWLRADGPFEVFVWTHPDGEISRMQVIMMNHFVEWNDGKGLKSGEITSIKNHDSPLVTEEEFEFLIDPKLDELKLQFASRIVNGVDAEGLDPEVYDFLCRKLGNAS